MMTVNTIHANYGIYFAMTAMCMQTIKIMQANFNCVIQLLVQKCFPVTILRFSDEITANPVCNFLITVIQNVSISNIQGVPKKRLIEVQRSAISQIHIFMS